MPRPSSSDRASGSNLESKLRPPKIARRTKSTAGMNSPDRPNRTLTNVGSDLETPQGLGPELSRGTPRTPDTPCGSPSLRSSRTFPTGDILAGAGAHARGARSRRPSESRVSRRPDRPPPPGAGAWRCQCPRRRSRSASRGTSSTSTFAPNSVLYVAVGECWCLFGSWSSGSIASSARSCRLACLRTT